MRDMGSESEMSAKVRPLETETVFSVKGQRKKKIYTMAKDSKRKLHCFHMVLGEKRVLFEKMQSQTYALHGLDIQIFITTRPGNLKCVINDVKQ